MSDYRRCARCRYSERLTDLVNENTQPPDRLVCINRKRCDHRLRIRQRDLAAKRGHSF